MNYDEKNLFLIKLYYNKGNLFFFVKYKCIIINILIIFYIFLNLF
jgi:hypothetical protein